MDINDLVKRIDELILKGRSTLSTARQGDYWESVDRREFKGFRSAVLSFIERVYGAEGSYYKEFYSSVSRDHPENIEEGIGILQSMRDEIAGGWLISFKGLVTAEIFADFLEMAEYLLAQDYQHPAAVVAGSVLEEHLRQLCTKNGIDLVVESGGRRKRKKADELNSDLAKAEVYNKLDQKQVTTWLDLRNKAAHGEYDQYTKEQVRQMVAGVTEFLARVKI